MEWRANKKEKKWKKKRRALTLLSVCVSERPCNRIGRKSFLWPTNNQPRQSSSDKQLSTNYIFLTRIHRLPTYAEWQSESQTSMRFFLQSPHQCRTYWLLIAVLTIFSFHFRRVNFIDALKICKWIHRNSFESTECMFDGGTNGMNNKSSHKSCLCLWLCVCVSFALLTYIIIVIIHITNCAAHFTVSLAWKTNHCFFDIEWSRPRCSQSCAASTPAWPRRFHSFFFPVSFNFMLIGSGVDFIKTSSHRTPRHHSAHHVRVDFQSHFAACKTWWRPLPCLRYGVNCANCFSVLIYRQHLMWAETWAESLAPAQKNNYMNLEQSTWLKLHKHGWDVTEKCMQSVFHDKFKIERGGKSKSHVGTCHFWVSRRKALQRYRHRISSARISTQRSISICVKLAFSFARFSSEFCEMKTKSNDCRLDQTPNLSYENARWSSHCMRKHNQHTIRQRTGSMLRNATLAVINSMIISLHILWMAKEWTKDINKSFRHISFAREKREICHTKSVTH